MFIGRHYHTIDSKARVAVPHKFRAELGGASGRLIVTATATSTHRSLDLIPLETWEIFLHELQVALTQGPHTTDTREALLATYIHAAQEVALDNQGRILVPPDHRTYAGLTRDVVSSGDIRKVRLWSVESYAGFLTETAKNRDKIQEISGVWL